MDSYSRIAMDGKLVAFRQGLTAAQLKRMLPTALESARREQHNLVIRPRGTTPLIQLDDLSATELHRVAPVAFLTVETSPGNHQAWVAVQGGTPDIARRLRNGTGADLNASGSVRIAGSCNYKPKYAPSFPTVTLIDTSPGRIVSGAELAPFLAPPQGSTWVRRVSAGKPKGWPNYSRIIAGAPPNNSGTGPDVSRADYLWCRISAQFGHTPDEIADRLLQLSEKAKREGQRYASRTAESAFNQR